LFNKNRERSAKSFSESEKSHVNSKSNSKVCPKKAGRARKIGDFYIIGKQQSAARKKSKTKATV
jgi:hypothetical protein